MKKNIYKEGFVILYAVIITTVVLVVGVSLMNIITKQLFLSSISRSSKVAYYAALSGRNCAEFWRTATDSNGQRKYFINGDYVSDIKCLGQDDLFYGPTFDTNTGITTFSFNIDNSNGQKSCAIVNVTYDKNKCPSNQTLVFSEGYNVSCSDVPKNPPRLVRSIYRDRVVVSTECPVDTSTLP